MPLIPVSTIKNFGVNFLSNLSFNNHVDTIYNQSLKLYVIRMYKIYKPEHHKIFFKNLNILYVSLDFSILD